MRAATRGAVVLAVGTLVGGCIVGLRMQPPEDLDGVSQVLDVSGRSRFGRGLTSSEDFALGPYRVSQVDRDWSHVRGSVREPWYIGGRQLETTSHGGFSFAFAGGEETLAGVCETARLSGRWQFGSWSFGNDSPSLGCRCRRGAKVVSSLFVAGAGAGSRWDGWLELGGTRYRVEGQNRLEGNKTSAGPAGYRFEAPAAPPLGAVDIMEPGRVWLHDGLSEADRQAAGCAAAALLLDPTPPQPSTDELPDSYRERY